MSRKQLNTPAKERTTIVCSKQLLDKMSVHVKKCDGNQTDFITRAIINQMEREGDFEIRLLMREEGYDV